MTVPVLVIQGQSDPFGMPKSGRRRTVVVVAGNHSLSSDLEAVAGAAGRWLANMSQYHAIKYGAESQEMSLRDIYRLTRPKLTGEADAIARWIVKGEVAPDSGLAQILGYEAFKKAAREASLEEEAAPTSASGHSA